jgi:Protein of unknown function (DUF3667)
MSRTGPTMSNASRECTNCHAPLRGRFCGRCGQENRPPDPTLREVVAEVVHEISDLDGRILRSVRRLFLSPGFLTKEHLAGRRVAWVSPIRLYLIFSVAYFAITSFTGAPPLNLNFQLTDASAGSAAQPFDLSIEGETQRAANEALAAWIPRAMFILVPVFAWLLSMVRRRAGRNYPHHLIFACHVFAAFFGAQALAVAVGWAVGHPMVGPALGVAAFVYGLIYLVLAIRSVYGGTLARALVHAMLVLAFYWVATIVVAGAIVGPLVWARFQASPVIAPLPSR